MLLDLDLGRFGDGMSLIAPLARDGANVVVVTASTDHGRWGACVRQGARKVLSKGRPLQETLSTVRRLHQGLPVMTSDELERCSTRGAANGWSPRTCDAGSSC